MNYITSAQAAARLGITPRRVLALIKSGRLPADRPGLEWLIDPADLAKVADRKPGRPRRQQ
jgi:excisionase family DNA binding protein